VVAFLTGPAPILTERLFAKSIRINEARKIARPRFRVRTPCCQRSYQTSFCPYALLKMFRRKTALFTLNKPSVHILTLMRRSLGTSDRFSEVYRPSQTAHLTLFPTLRKEAGFAGFKPQEVSNMRVIGWCYIGALIVADATIASLPPTLYDHHHITTSSCSKVQRGLLVPLKVS
jgi:hypothetical protein